jgi:hypothetical protein
MVKILLAYEIAETCFLIQAMLYRAVGRLPLQVSEDEATNLVLTPQECRAGGLQPDPEWEESENGGGESLLNSTVAAPPESEERQRLYEQWIKWKAVKEWRRSEWKHGFQELLRRHHGELLTALLEGRLKSQGKRSVPLINEEMIDGASWPDKNWEAIPSTYWPSCQIDWEMCQAKATTATYDSILVDTDDLFREFPLPTPQLATDVSKCGAYFVLSDEFAGPTLKLGRPPEFAWDELHLEIARRVVKSDLPEKLEAFYEDMRNWCQSQWGKRD